MRHKFLIILLSLPFSAYSAIEDNSFLLEEAYNQEWGVYQFIQKFQTANEARGYEYSFGNEIPITDKTQQFSYDFSFGRPDGEGHGAISDLTLSYRIQPYNKDGILVADRFGLIVPTGRIEKHAGYGVYGFSFMQAATLNIDEIFATHYNFGFDLLPNAKTSGHSKRRSLVSFTAGTSLVYLWKDSINFLVEGLLYSTQTVEEDGAKIAETFFTINPGMRFAMDFDWYETQVVPGISFPTELLNGPTEHGVLVYFSFEPKVN